jgi:hypothetical protein
MSKLHRDEAVIAAIQVEGRCLLGSAADIYNVVPPTNGGKDKDGKLNKRHHDQLQRLGLMTQKAAPTNSYALQVYAIEPDALFKAF